MEDILKTVKRKNQAHTVLGFQGTLNEISKHFGIKYATLWFHREDGNLEKIITKHLNKKKRKELNV